MLIAVCPPPEAPVPAALEDDGLPNGTLPLPLAVLLLLAPAVEARLFLNDAAQAVGAGGGTKHNAFRSSPMQQLFHIQ
jgi:hypothetical protein